MNYIQMLNYKKVQTQTDTSFDSNSSVVFFLFFTFYPGVEQYSEKPQLLVPGTIQYSLLGHQSH